MPMGSPGIDRRKKEGTDRMLEITKSSGVRRRLRQGIKVARRWRHQAALMMSAGSGWLLAASGSPFGAAALVKYCSSAAANEKNVCSLLDARDCRGGFGTGIGLEPSGHKIYSALGSTCLIFNEDVVGSVHIFRQKHMVKVIADAKLRDACHAAGIKDPHLLHDASAR